MHRQCRTLQGPLGYNEFGYNEQPATTSRFLCIKLLVVTRTEVILNY